jgi:2-hydroxy-3-keto-5-methylthiopentenyl-1-phosphate phosphatase
MSEIFLQFDFDGTMTMEDLSFHILDEYAEGDWRTLLAEYRAGGMPVGEFNTRAFALVRQDEATLRDFIRGKVRLRPGLKELVAYCRENGHPIAIVSNGLDFYVRTILEDAGLGDIEFHAALTRFDPAGLNVNYIGPDGAVTLSGFKDAYMETFRKPGRRIVYLGDGLSDIYPARAADYVFACKELATICREQGVPHTAFESLLEVRDTLKKLPEILSA